MPNDASQSPSRPVDIALLAYAGCMGAEVFSVADMLLIANRLAVSLEPSQAEPFSVQVVSVAGGAVALAGGFAIATRRLRGQPALLVVPGLELGGFGQWDTKLSLLAREIALIRRHAARGTSLASVCIGSFLLAEAGALESRKATTAWPFATEFAARYPGVKLNASAVLLQDGRVTTTGAVSSAFDLGVHLVSKYANERLSRAAARFALVGAGRITQLPYVDKALVPMSKHPFTEQVNRLLLAGMGQGYDLKALAATLNVSPRTLLRRYAAEAGMTPLTWLQRARVEKAKQLLEKTRLGLGQIVVAVGYQDVPTFSRLFVREVQETPAQYRRRNSQRAVRGS